MSDDGLVPEDRISELLGQVGEQTSPTAPERERARAAMLAEFDTIVAGRRVDEDSLTPPPAPAIELDQALRPSTSGAPRRWPVAAAGTAAGLLVLVLAVVTSFRDDTATSVVPPTPTSLDVPTSTLDPPLVLTGRSLPLMLGDGVYRTDDIGEGLTFTGAAGLQLVDRRAGLLVLDEVDGEQLRARISMFEADPEAIDSIIGTATDLGRLKVDEASFSVAGRSVPRWDLTITAEGLAELGCADQTGCLPLGAGDDGPSIWGRSENFLVRLGPDDPTVFVLVQSTIFGDPVLGQAFEIIDSIRPV